MKPVKKIINELSSTGMVICPVCNRPPSWMEGGKIFSSPMVRISMSNLDALIHNGCLHQLYTDINGQISITRRNKLIFGFLPAVGKFLAGCARLLRLLFSQGIEKGLKEFHRETSSVTVLPMTGGRVAVCKRTFGHGSAAR